jgi:Mg2+-importing ATPase
VNRDGESQEVPLEEVVVGDVISLPSATWSRPMPGYLTAKDLFLSQSALTGESEPVEKTPTLPDPNASLTDRSKRKRRPPSIKGSIRSAWLFVRFMLVMVPAVFLINGFTKHDWLSAFLFAISVAVGLTPEMLPMIVTSCLAKGAITMGKKKVIIKNINSIQNFGAMDIFAPIKRDLDPRPGRARRPP